MHTTDHSDQPHPRACFFSPSQAEAGWQRQRHLIQSSIVVGGRRALFKRARAGRRADKRLPTNACLFDEPNSRIWLQTSSRAILGPQTCRQLALVHLFLQCSGSAAAGAFWSIFPGSGAPEQPAQVQCTPVRPCRPRPIAAIGGCRSACSSTSIHGRMAANDAAP